MNYSSLEKLAYSFQHISEDQKERTSLQSLKLGVRLFRTLLGCIWLLWQSPATTPTKQTTHSSGFREICGNVLVKLCCRYLWMRQCYDRFVSPSFNSASPRRYSRTSKHRALCALSILSKLTIASSFINQTAGASSSHSRAASSVVVRASFAHLLVAIYDWCISER